MSLGSPILRVSLGIAMLTLTLLLTADVIFGLSTESMRPHLLARKHLAETLAVQYSELAAREDHTAMKRAMSLLVERNSEVLSTAVRKVGGEVLAEAGDHRRYWRGAAPVDSTETHARVPIFDGLKRWGTLEVRFTELAQATFSGLIGSPWFKLLCFVLVGGTIAYFVYMRRTLRHLDPASVIPARVRAAFDVLAEGVAFVDKDGRIVLVNIMFATMAGRSAEQLMGIELGRFRWSLLGGSDTGVLPWIACLNTGKVRSGEALALENDGGERREFMVNCAPILDDAKQSRGAIVTFDDITELEQKKQALEQAVANLRVSRDQIQRQAEKLEIVATRDPLTNCLNRRAFVEILQDEVTRARADGTPLACIMLDIDHFKSVNDTFGHSAGDAAICFAAGVVSEVTRGFDIVCRYGGEEFCVLLPTANLDSAYRVSERIRETIEATSLTSLPEIEGRGMTISLGVSMLDESIDNPMHLVDRADEALYLSKTSGRNRTTVAGGKEAGSSTAA